jgi:hypothetical protein
LERARVHLEYVSRYGAQFLLWVIAAAALCLLCSCAYFQKRGLIKSGNVTVAAVGDAGKPGELHTSDRKESLPIPAGSKTVVTKTEATPATDKTPFKPRTEVTEITFNGPTEWQKFDTSVSANTGTVDTSVALKKVESAESRPLLYAAIASLLAAGFFLYRAYPTPAFACGGAAVVFFIAWKASGLPDWFWAVGACALAGAVALYLGHERGEKAAVVAGTPITPVAVAAPVTFSPVATPNVPPIP